MSRCMCGAFDCESCRPGCTKELQREDDIELLADELGELPEIVSLVKTLGDAERRIVWQVLWEIAAAFHPEAMTPNAGVTGAQRSEASALTQMLGVER